MTVVVPLALYSEFTPVVLWRCNRCGVIVGKQDAAPFHRCKPIEVRFGNLGGRACNG